MTTIALDYDDIYNDAWSRGDLVEWLIHLDKENDELHMKITALEDELNYYKIPQQILAPIVEHTHTILGKALNLNGS